MKKNNLMYNAAILFVALVVATTVSCKKDDDSSLSRTELITGKNFVVTAKVVSPAIEYGGLEITDVFAFIPDCTKDDITVFNTDGSVTFDEGASKCDEGSPQTTTGSWEFQDNETKLKVISDGLTEIFTIIELSSGTLKTSYEVVDEDKTYTYTITFFAN